MASIHTTDSQPLALRPKDAAKALGIGTRTLWEYTRRGLIPHIRIGSGKRTTVLYPIDQLREFLRQGPDLGKAGQG